MAQKTDFSNRSLASDAVEVFCLDVPPEYRNLVLREDRVARVLNAAEMARFRKYLVPGRRNDLVLSRVLFQTIMVHLGLSRTGPWRIEKDSNGKPFAVSPSGEAPFHLNTSDTDGLILWALSRSGPLGCDVERLGRDTEELAVQYFAPDEISEYRRLAGRERTRFFYRIWTLKESVLKADGRGLTLPLDSFVLRLGDDSREPAPSVDIVDGAGGPASGPWRLHCFEPGDGHQAAVAAVSDRELEFRVHHLRLDEFDADLEKPWRLVRDPAERPQDTPEVFGVYDRSAGAGPV